MTPSQELHSLPYLLAHVLEAQWALWHPEEGANGNESARNALERVWEKAQDQIDLIIDLALEEVGRGGASTSVRLDHRTRLAPSEKQWNCAMSLLLPRARSPFARIGIRVGRGTSGVGELWPWFSYARAGQARGRALAERLRQTGTRVDLTEGRAPWLDWPRGTLILGRMPLTRGVTADACAAFAGSAAQLIWTNWERVTEVDEG